jgi:hypothetical protein
MGEIQVKFEAKGSETVYSTPDLTYRLQAADSSVIIEPSVGQGIKKSKQVTVADKFDRMDEFAFAGAETAYHLQMRSFLQCVLGEFWRNKFDRQFPEPLPKHWPRHGKDLVRFEAELWEDAFDCLEQINMNGKWKYPYPVTDLGAALERLVGEQLLIGFIMRRLPDGATNARDAVIRPEQRNNQALAEMENPFPSDSFTHAFVKSCLSLAGKSENFDRKHWRPLLKHRRAYLQLMKNGSIILRNCLSGDSLSKSRVPAKARKVK